MTNPRVVTLTVEHQGKLLISYSFSAEYPKKRRVFNSESHHPVLPCTLMTTMQITTATGNKLLVPLYAFPSLNLRTEAQEEVTAFLFYWVGLCLGMWTTPKKQERGASDGSLCANLYGCSSGAMGKPPLDLWCAHWSRDSAKSYAYALFDASRLFHMFDFTYMSGPSVSVKFKMCKRERKHRIIKGKKPKKLKPPPPE